MLQLGGEMQPPAAAPGNLAPVLHLISCDWKHIRRVRRVAGLDLQHAKRNAPNLGAGLLQIVHLMPLPEERMLRLAGEWQHPTRERRPLGPESQHPFLLAAAKRAPRPY
jgi:hypothetical protein